MKKTKNFVIYTAMLVTIAFLVGCGSSIGETGGETPERSVALEWTKPVTYDDLAHTPLGSDLTGFVVYYGEASGPPYSNMKAVSNTTSCIINGLPSGKTFFFAVTAQVSSGIESVFSSEVSTIVR